MARLATVAFVARTSGNDHSNSKDRRRTSHALASPLGWRRLCDAVFSCGVPAHVSKNDLFKVLTIVSVVGIPPTIVVGIYGMNFKFMPELNWAWGYPIALAVVGLSALIPLLWFKWRGWFD
jgi:CorA-like Mg2+ transporter protein